MPGRRRGGVGAVALALIACPASTSPRADSSFERIGVGAGFAMPTPSLSLFGRRDARWSGMATLGIGAELRINYEREGSNGGYWTAGAGYVLGALGVVRGGYGRAWRRGSWRWHLEATLNLPVYIHDDGDGYASLGTAVAAAYTVLIPVGFGVHYVFD